MGQTKIRNEQYEDTLDGKTIDGDDNTIRDIADTSINNTCAFRAQLSSDTDYNDTNPIIFNSEIFDEGSDYNSSTGIFTAPVAGLYFFSCGLRTNDSASSTRVMGAEFRSDAATAYSGFQFAAVNQYTGASGGCIRVMAVNDTMRVNYRGTASTTLEGNNRNYFEGFLIAATA